MEGKAYTATDASGVTIDLAARWYDQSKAFSVRLDRERFKRIGRTDVGDSQIGQLLGRTSAEADGVWPNEAVRDALEACGTDRLIREMQIGPYNNRAAIWRGTGGDHERSLATKCAVFARQLQADFPVIAQMLDGIVQFYERERDVGWHYTDEAVRQQLSRH